MITKSARARLTTSIKDHKLVGPLVWNVKTGNLVGGHQRLSIIDSLEGSENYTIKVDRVDLEDAEEKALNIVLNNRQAQGDWDLDLLRDCLEDVISSDLNLAVTGFADFDLQQFGDAFTPLIASKQSEVEAPIIAQFSEIKIDSAEHRPVFEREVANHRGPDVSSIQDDEYEDVEDEPPSTIDPETNNKTFTPDQREQFREAKQRHKESTQDQYDGDVTISLTFGSSAQLRKFIALVGADPDSRYWPPSVIASIFKIDLSN